MYEVGKYYYNNLVLVKVVSIDENNNVLLKDYDNAYSAELLDLMGYYEFPIADPEGFAAKLKQ